MAIKQIESRRKKEKEREKQTRRECKKDGESVSSAHQVLIKVFYITLEQSLRTS